MTFFVKRRQKYRNRVFVHDTFLRMGRERDKKDPLCIMVVNCGACIPPVAKHSKHGLLYSPSIIDTLGTSVGSSMLRLVLCCLRS